MTTAAGSALTRLHYRQQVAVRAAAVGDARTLWSLYSPGNYASWDQLESLAIPMLRSRHAESAAIARNYYSTLSLLETGTLEQAMRIKALDEVRLVKSLQATGLVGSIRALSVGMTPQAASANGLVRLTGSYSRLALEGGRQTLIGSSSRTALGWERVVSTKPCTFCAMLASRGAVYNDATVDFKAHDHCSCSVRPVFD